MPVAATVAPPSALGGYWTLTCDANADVRPIYPKAMPVILTTEAERDAWMTAPVAEALELQHPLADGSLRIVARGAREDE